MYVSFQGISRYIIFQTKSFHGSINKVMIQIKKIQTFRIVTETGQEREERHQFSTLHFASSLVFIQVHSSVEEVGVLQGTYSMWCVWPWASKCCVLL